jgi:hypothetical protein
MVWLRFATNIISVAALALTAAVPAQASPASLPRGDLDRAGIMDGIRNGVGSDAVFNVGFIRIDRTATPPLAYAEVVPADSRSPGFRGWALLKLYSAPAGHVWKVITALDYRKLSGCTEVVAEAETVWDLVSERSSTTLLGPMLIQRRGVHSARTEANGKDMPWIGVCAGRVIRPQ